MTDNRPINFIPGKDATDAKRKAQLKLRKKIEAYLMDKQTKPTA